MITSTDTSVLSAPCIKIIILCHCSFDKIKFYNFFSFLFKLHGFLYLFGIFTVSKVEFHITCLYIYYLSITTRTVQLAHTSFFLLDLNSTFKFRYLVGELVFLTIFIFHIFHLSFLSKDSKELLLI